MMGEHTEDCDSCVYSQKFSDNDVHRNWRRCVRYPPSTTYVVHPTIPDMNIGDWPKVYKYCWCGEYKWAEPKRKGVKSSWIKKETLE